MIRGQGELFFAMSDCSRNIHPDPFIAMKSTTTGLGQPVRPLIRVLAAIIGSVSLLALVLHAVLTYLGAPGYKLDVSASPELFLFALFAAYGICIGVRGKAPKGVLPWK